ncbi:3-deoxy-7-phosphoheptulonate synthase [Sulfodiicoccus acidiphilus]|uniref:3-deoxy-7-phosphoheptulonate synthase n=1 Tax=Sulfodiicoccus acidiphilus TaxID=1670455 RepID=A0A348B106_9CREN|nr:3-deoxy-7-phosphoheptulonate synthase [Sulfodiicoccus acidiphilus]BBD71858.1 3-deoxy-7-phosphoheptulonate synthase [Sulfodiicoccus acidiphilus]GGU02486.1 3-deoxy-7-phosphoheptulonate synthase [Sulfodiicoccus acidiphilus]
MILFILKEGADPRELKERLASVSASWKEVSLYGMSLILAWPDEYAAKVSDQSVVSKVKTTKPYPLASNEWKEKTLVEVGNVEIGGKRVVVAAGPCAVEDEQQVVETAQAVKRAGAALFRGGAYKPRTSPYSFQGLGEEGLKLLRRAGDEAGLPVVSEVVDPRDLPAFKGKTDMLQIGARNAQNFQLLKDVGRIGLPVLLKRGMGNTVEEWLLSAEYLLSEGNGRVVLCERGIRTFERSTRFTLDVGGMVVARQSTHLPVGADPSHPAGRRELVHALTLAAVAAGADLVIVEVHPNPERAKSDSEQQLTFDSFRLLMNRVTALAKAIGRDI